MRRRQARIPLVFGVLLICGSTACGSTAASTGATTSTNVDGLGGATTTTTASGAPGAPGIAAGAQRSESVDERSPSVNAGQAPAPASGPAGTAVAPGRAAQPTARQGGIARLGFLYLKNSDATINALGGNGKQSLGDEEAAFKVLVKNLNARGGLVGQRVDVEYYGIDSQSTQPLAAVQAAFCSYFTEDRKVSVVLTTLSNRIDDNVRRCLGRKGVGLLSGSFTSADDRTFSAFPLYVEPAALRVDRIAAALGTSAPLPPGAKVGVLGTRRMLYEQATTQILAPALRQRGFRPEVILVRDPNDDLSATQSDIANAVLRFRSANVTHVVLLSPDGVNALLFTNNAESQQYRPAYRFTSHDALQGTLDGGFIQNPDQQLANASGLGWHPWLDVPLAENPQRAAGKPCLDELRKGGVNPTASAARWHVVLDCDLVVLLEEAAKHDLTPFSAAGVVRSIAKLDRSHLPFATFGTRFAPGQLDGADRVRRLSYIATCGCLRYQGGDVAVRR